MLAKLSGFLRATLSADPDALIALEDELVTLQHYLEIESIRFGERLQVDFICPPGLNDALVPSFLLQPLVENAIKYAVSPQEEGARISLSAQLVGHRLRLTVSDTGPGLRARSRRATLPQATFGKHESTGVGLANIRDRLAQAYGEDHLFEIRTPADGGFTVVIEVPLERAPETPSVAPAKPQAVPSVTPAPAQRALGFDT